MKAKYCIPQKDLDFVVSRDKKCVYCNKKMDYPYNSKVPSVSATIEHLNHRKDWDSVRSYLNEGKSIPEIIAICCASCNSSRNNLPLKKWFESNYCRVKNIKYNTVSKTVRRYIDKYEK